MKYRKPTRNFLTLTNCFLLLLALSFSPLYAQTEYEESLQVRELAEGIQLNWESNPNDITPTFVVERSKDNSNFEQIEVMAPTTSITVSTSNLVVTPSSQFTFRDMELGLDKVAYRIKYVTKDGSYSYSKPTNIDKATVNYFRVVGKDKISDDLYEYTVNSIVKGDMKYSLYNKEGDPIQKEVQTLNTGINKLLINLEAEAEGTYTLILRMDQESKILTLDKEDTNTENKKNVANQSKSSNGG